MRSLALLAIILVAPQAAAQEPAAVWPHTPLTAGPTPAEVVPSSLPPRPACDPPADAQQQWFALHLTALQPFTGRVQFKVLPRANNSVWLEAYAGSVLFDGMYGFGARVNHTAKAWGNNDFLTLSPGLGVHIIPGRGTWWGHSTLYYLAADVDVAWVHDFSPHFRFELGVKVGIAGRVGGEWRDSGPRPNGVMFGPDFYPLFSVYSGFRF